MAEFDPSEGTVTEVNEYLDAHPDQAEAVLAAERDGKARLGILEGPHAPQDAAGDQSGTEGQAEGDEAPGEALEVGTDKGFMGERYDQTPLDAYTLSGVTTSDEAARADASPGSPTADGPPVGGEDAITTTPAEDSAAQDQEN